MVWNGMLGRPAPLRIGSLVVVLKVRANSPMREVFMSALLIDVRINDFICTGASIEVNLCDVNRGLIPEVSELLKCDVVILNHHGQGGLKDFLHSTMPKHDGNLLSGSCIDNAVIGVEINMSFTQCFSEIRTVRSASVFYAVAIDTAGDAGCGCHRYRVYR